MNTVAQTIYDQLGGRRFAVMTGSNGFLPIGNSLRMKLARNKSRANRLKIEYDEASDTYTMTFYRLEFRRKEVEARSNIIEVCEDVYCDSLQYIFTEVTGLYTKL